MAKRRKIIVENQEIGTTELETGSGKKFIVIRLTSGEYKVNPLEFRIEIDQQSLSSLDVKKLLEKVMH